MAKLCILNTRPTHQAFELTQQLESIGANVIELPMIEIKTLAINENINNIKSSNIVIAVSANVIGALSSIWPKDLEPYVIAIGPGTAQALQHMGIHVSSTPEHYSSEGILSMPILQDVADKNIFILCGQDPKPLLSDTLIQRGANVSQIICYHRICPHPTQEQLHSLVSKPINLIISTSQANLKNLYSILGGSHSDWLSQIPLLVVSQSMLELAQSYQHQAPIHVAKDASNASLVAEVQQFQRNKSLFLGA